MDGMSGSFLFCFLLNVDKLVTQWQEDNNIDTPDMK